jgi:hypothetical protein
MRGNVVTGTLAHYHHCAGSASVDEPGRVPSRVALNEEAFQKQILPSF